MPADTSPQTPTKSRVGLWLFTLYCAIYLGFMIVCACFPGLAQAQVAGLNLAVLYGLGLIIGAVVLAGLYVFLDKNPEHHS